MCPSFPSRGSGGSRYNSASCKTQVNVREGTDFDILSWTAICCKMTDMRGRFPDRMVSENRVSPGNVNLSAALESLGVKSLHPYKAKAQALVLLSFQP